MRTAMIALLLSATPAFADLPVVEAAKASRSGAGWRFDVTLSHPDTGWDHYADGWEIRAPDGTRLGFRELLHPHVNEQPFTRSLSGVAIPDDVKNVRIRARCNTDGWSDDSFTLTLPR